MQNLLFNQLLLVSDSLRSANQFEFDPNLTLITANDNSVGKSTLVKLIFWALGCEPVLDTKWAGTDCKVMLRFSVNSDKYEVVRYKDMLSIRDRNALTRYNKVSGEFSERIASIFQFSALLPKRGKEELVVPPPAYYFIPFYIDQKRSWANAWDNFLSLTQFDSWKPTIIKYHIGLLPPMHFNLELDKFLKKKEESDLSSEATKLDAAIEIVENYIVPSVRTINNDRLSYMTDEIQKDLKDLSARQEVLLNELVKAEADQTFLKSQKVISEKIILELQADYSFSVENVSEDHIECPLCGTIHENSVVNRASILADKMQAEQQLTEISNSLEDVKMKIHKANNELQQIKVLIDQINSKYVIEENDEVINTSSLIETIAGSSIKHKVMVRRENNVIKMQTVKKEIKSISKEQKKVISDEDKDRIIKAFNSIFATYISMLNAESVNIAEINSPLDYGKVVKEGGAAEGTRAILAYYLTIYSLINTFGSEILAPLVMDTPNQQEQSHINYDKIVELILDKLYAKSQVILCAMDNEILNPIKEKASIIFLDSNKLLKQELFDTVSNEFKEHERIN